MPAAGDSAEGTMRKLGTMRASISLKAFGWWDPEWPREDGVGTDTLPGVVATLGCSRTLYFCSQQAGPLTLRWECSS